jgi:hypothetical protein
LEVYCVLWKGQERPKGAFYSNSYGRICGCYGRAEKL